MKKIIAIACLYTVLLLTACATIGGRGALSLHDAIRQSAERIAGELPAGSRVAIVAFESENDNLSNYIMEELAGTLFDLGIEVADRRNLEYLYREFNFQMSGEVSDETAVSIGKFLGANMVITGQLINLDGVYRYRTSVIRMEQATRASVTMLNVRGDSEMRRMVAALARQQTVVTEIRYGVSEDKTPQTAGTFLDRGIMLAMRGDYEMAIIDFTEAIRLKPDMATAYILRGRALYASVSTVFSIYDNFSGLSTDISTRNITETQREVYDKAIADFSQAISLQNNNVNAYTERGRVYNYRGDYDTAIADNNQAIRLDPNNVTAYTNRGLSYIYKKDYDRATADLDQATRLDPTYALAFAYRGLTYFYKGEDYDQVIEDSDQAIRLEPTVALAYLLRGLGYRFGRNEYDQAIADFTMAIQLYPRYYSAYGNRALVYSILNDYDSVIADCNQMILLDPNNAEGFFDRGRAYYSKMDYVKANADFSEALRLDPDNPLYLSIIRKMPMPNLPRMSF